MTECRIPPRSVTPLPHSWERRWKVQGNFKGIKTSIKTKEERKEKEIGNQQERKKKTKKKFNQRRKKENKKKGGTRVEFRISKAKKGIQTQNLRASNNF